MVDDPFGVGTQALRLLEQRVVDIGRGNAAAPGSRSQRVVEIELRRGLDDGVGAIGRAGAVRDRDVPRGRDQHQTRRLGFERKPEIGAVADAHAIGIESILFHAVSAFRTRFAAGRASPQRRLRPVGGLSVSRGAFHI